jgi:cytochrome c biogenesis protein CcdA
VESSPPSAVGKAARNERRKFLATTLNAAGLTTLGFGLLGPILGTTTTGVGVQSVVSGAIWLVAYALGRHVLGTIED